MDKLALLLILTTGCFVSPTNGEVPSPQGEETAVGVVWDFFQKEKGPLPYPNIPIQWYEGPCLEGPPIDKHAANYNCVTGLYYHNRSHAVIYLVEFNTLHNSSLAHELVHYWLDYEGDSDHSHENEEWWSLLKDANKYLASWECAVYPSRCE